MRDRFQGTLTNAVPVPPIENATLVLDGNMVQIGRMEPGETKIWWTMGCFATRWEILIWRRSISPGEDAYASRGYPQQELYAGSGRSSLTRFYLDNYLSSYTADARSLPSSTQKEESQFLKNPSEETYGITMLTQTGAVNASRDSSIYRCAP